MELVASILFATALAAGPTTPSPEALDAVVAPSDRMNASDLDERTRLAANFPNERNRLFASEAAAQGRWDDALRLFTTAAFPPGRYFVSALKPNLEWHIEAILIDGQDWYDKAIVLRDRDLTDVVVMLTDEPAALSGVVAVSGVTPNSTPWVALFPALVDKWIDDGMLELVSWRVRVGTDGAFTFRNVRPGQFLLAALPAETAIDLHDPAFIRRIAAMATPVTIRRGANRAPALKVLVSK